MPHHPWGQRVAGTTEGWGLLMSEGLSTWVRAEGSQGRWLMEQGVTVGQEIGFRTVRRAFGQRGGLQGVRWGIVWVSSSG